MQTTTPSPVLRPRAAASYCGMALSTLWARIKNDPTFPQPWKTSPRTTVLSREELDAWINRNRKVGGSGVEVTA